MTERIRRSNELLFSTYVALLVVAEEETCRRSSAFLRWLGYPLDDYLYPLLTRHHLHLPGSHSIALWIVLAVVIFIVVRLLAGFAPVAALMRYVPGFVGIAGLPVLLLPPCNLTALRLSPATWLCLYLEVILAVLSVLLYSLQRWPIKAALTTALLAGHFGVWGWLTWQRISNPFWAIYLLLAFSSTVLWALYSLQSQSDRAGGG